MAKPRCGNQNVITANPGVAESLDDKDGAAFSAAVLPASSAFRYSEVFSVRDARFLALQVFYAAHASTTTGQALVQVRVSNEEAAPAFDASLAWSELPITDDALGTAAALAASSLGTGVWETVGPLRNKQTVRGGSFMIAPAVANSDKIDIPLVLRVEAWRWCQVRVAEVGDTTNRGTVTLKASLTS